MKKSHTVQTIAITAIVCGAFWFVFRNVDVTELWNLLKSANVWYLMAAIPVVIVSHLVRAFRWKRLLSGSGTSPHVIDAFGALMVGYAASVVIPRSGEVLRPYYLSSRSDIPLGTTLTSIVIERMLDVLVLLLLTTLVFVLQRNRLLEVFPTLTFGTILTALVLPAIVITTLLLLLAFTRVVPQTLVGCIALRSKRMGVRVRSVLSSVKQGTAVLTSRHGWLGVLIETFAMWLLYVFPLLFVAKALPFLSFELSFFDACTLLVIITVGIAVAPTPGALGVYHGLMQVAMVVLFKATPTEGLGFALIAWLLNFGVQLVVGGVWFVIGRVRQPLTP